MSTGLDWGSEEASKATVKYTNWYKCRIYNKDIVRIADKLYVVYSHNWQEGGRFQRAMCSLEEHGTCPFCDKLKGVGSHERKQMFATTLLHLVQKPQEGKPRRIGKLLAWRFAEGKKDQLVEINELVTGTKKGGKKRGVMDVDLQIRLEKQTKDCEQFQNVTIQRMDSEILKEDKVLAETVKSEYTKEKLEKIKRLYKPHPEDLAKWIKDDEEAASFDPSEFDDPDEKESKSENEIDESEAFLDGEDALDDLNLD